MLAEMLPLAPHNGQAGQAGQAGQVGQHVVMETGNGTQLGGAGQAKTRTGLDKLGKRGT